jgi:hypothetical protein
MTFKVLEVDQWTSTGSIKEFTLAQWEADPKGTLNKMKGGDSEAARAIFGGHVRILEVDDGTGPMIGNVWFREGPDGILFQWKYSYDSSD